MFFIKQNYQAEVVNPIVRRVLFTLWANLSRELINKSGYTGKEIGDRLEREVMKSFACNSLSLDPFSFDSIEKQPAQLQITKVDYLVVFAQNNPPKVSPFECVLFYPKEQNYAGQDFIIADGAKKLALFVSVSIASPSKHKKDGKYKILNSFEKMKNHQRNRLEEFLDCLLDCQGTTAQVSDGRFCVTLPDTRNDWKVKFLFISGTKEQEIKKEPFDLKDVMILAQESFTNSLGLKWQ